MSNTSTPMSTSTTLPTPAQVKLGSLKQQWKETSLTELRHMMRSDDLLEYLYQNGLSIGIVSCS